MWFYVFSFSNVTNSSGSTPVLLVFGRQDAIRFLLQFTSVVLKKGISLPNLAKKGTAVKNFSDPKFAELSQNLACFHHCTLRMRKILSLSYILKITFINQLIFSTI